jgi:teichuronic acid exporter
MQDQKHELQLGLLNAIRILAYITFPLIYGMASVAPEFIPAVLGPHWDGAVLPLQIIAVVIPLRMISSLYSTAIFGMGRSDVVFRNTLVGVVVFPLCFYIGAQWGAVGLAAGWLIGMPTVFLINFNQMRRVIGISYLDLIRSIAHPFCSALCMVGALLFIRIFLPKTLDNWIVLACLIFFGATVFSVFAFSIDVRLRKDIQNTVWARYFHHRQ